MRVRLFNTYTNLEDVNCFVLISPNLMESFYNLETSLLQAVLSKLILVCTVCLILFEFLVNTDTKHETNKFFDHDLNNSESDSESDLDLSIKKEKVFLCERSEIEVETFKTLFMGLTDRLSMPEQHRETLLSFIRLIFPRDNNIPDSHYRIKKSIKISNIKKTIICKTCSQELMLDCQKSKNCTNEVCPYYQKLMISRDFIRIFSSNIERQILDDHYEAIINYQSIKYLKIFNCICFKIIFIKV